MRLSVFLDSTPLGLLSQRPGRSADADLAHAWLSDLLSHGCVVYVPELADYEVRRELVRLGRADSVVRLNALCERLRYLPISTEAMRLAADLWARARSQGMPTAHAHALDGDVILASQVLTVRPAPLSLAVATGNVSQLSRFVRAEEWSSIRP